MSLPAPDALPAERFGPIAWRRLGERVVITTPMGDWQILKSADFEALLRGDLEDGDPTLQAMRGHRFLKADLDVEDAASRLRRRYHFLQGGPHLHRLALGWQRGDRMAEAIADKAVDLAFMATSDHLEIELAGDAVAEAIDVARHAVEYAATKNELARKRVRTAVEVDPGTLDDAAIAWMVEAGVGLRALLDAETLGGADTPAAERMKAYSDGAGEGAAVAVVECTPEVVTLGAEVAERLIALGCREVTLRPEEPATWLTGDEPAVSVEAWLAFYGAVLERSLSLMTGDSALILHQAAVLLERILGVGFPSDRELRSPASDAIGQLAYDTDGTVYTSWDGLWIGRLGDPVFAIGHVERGGYHDLMSHETVRALIVASCAEAQPDGRHAAYAPFAGHRPARSYAEQGSIHGRAPDSVTSARIDGLLDMLFERLHARGRGPFEQWLGHR